MTNPVPTDLDALTLWAETLADPNFSLSVPNEAKRVITQLLTALRKEREQTEGPEREYGVGWNWGERTLGFKTESREAAEEHLWRYPEVEDGPQFLVWRTPEAATGPWTPVK